MTASAISLPRDYFELFEAFSRLGRLTYGDKWDGSEIDSDTVDVPITSTWEPNSKAGDRYKSVRLDLLEALYDGKISVSGIDQAGNRSEIPDYIWKDLTGCRVSIKNGRAWDGSDPRREWRVRIDRQSFIELLIKLHTQTIAPFQPTKDGNAKAVKVGNPGFYDWRTIEAASVRVLWNEDWTASDAGAAELLIKKLGSRAPSKSQLRAAVKKLRRRGLLPGNPPN